MGSIRSGYKYKVGLLEVIEGCAMTVVGGLKLRGWLVYERL